MGKKYFSFLLLLISLMTAAQKKPLDHTVYDSWQSIGERLISPDGQWIVYTVCPQEGDTTLVVQHAAAPYKKEIERGYSAMITDDSRYVIFKIRPYQQELRDARIKNKKADDLPKDSLGILELGNDTVMKTAQVVSYKLPARGSGWVAFRKEKSKDAPGTADGGDLLLKNLVTGEEKKFSLITEYFFDKKGSVLLMESSRSSKDSLGKNVVLLYHLSTGHTDTLSRGGNDFKNFVFDEAGSQLAFVAEREAAPGALQKFYSLWYYSLGMDSAIKLADKFSIGMPIGMTVSENGNLNFSKSGKRLFFGIAPVPVPKDTTLIEADLVKLDIWHYKDEYLQTQQLVQLNTELRRSYLAVYDLGQNMVRPLGSPEIPQVIQTAEGDGDIFIGITDVGKRAEAQWLGITRKDVYAIGVNDGTAKRITQNLHGQVYPSSTGNYILWYDRPAKNYFIWNGKSIKNISAKIKTALWNEEYDQPDNPPPYGLMGWAKGDSSFFVYDRYDIWQVDPEGINTPKNILNEFSGRKYKIVTRYVRTDPEEQFIDTKNMLVKRFSEINKESAYFLYPQGISAWNRLQKFALGTSVIKARNAGGYLFTKENFQQPPDLYLLKYAAAPAEIKTEDENDTAYQEKKLSSLNPQQKNYYWGTAELFRWKTPAGNQAEGIVYKPENLDPRKKYPVIIYFYEKLSDQLYDYIDPAPTRSAINVSYFVSNGYVVFYPNIHYGTGHPGKDAYEYVVSGARALASAYHWIDANRMGIQGHSWGGYQVAYLITKTNMFKAAWAGAPVVNMTSAYGGIRYGTGISRQWQYEKAQSRIGKNLWEALPRYMENSPLFSLDKVRTPVAILHNDNDDAVPYTQGLEMFTALKRLNKQVWMINYNGEPHGVVQRKNRKDLAIRFEQFFGWLLKDEQPARWLTDGIPAIRKGKDWGLEPD